MELDISTGPSVKQRQHRSRPLQIPNASQKRQCTQALRAYGNPNATRRHTTGRSLMRDQRATSCLAEEAPQLEQLNPAAPQVVAIASAPPNLFADVNLPSFMRFAEAAKPYMRELAHNHFLLVEVEQCPVICRPDKETQSSATNWIVSKIAVDPLAMHSIMFATQTFIEYKRTRDPSRSVDKTARLHLVKTLRLLQDGLTSRDATASDTTLMAIIYLSIVASCCGDNEAARHHAEGLSRIINLVGGLDSIGPLRVKACRADIGAAIASGTKPFLCPPGISQERHFSNPIDLADDLGLKALLSYADSSIVNAWADLRVVCATANRSRIKNESSKYDLAAYHEVMLPIMYRLLDIDCRSGSPDLALQLAMTIFSASIYLQFRGHPCRFDCMSEKLQAALVMLPSSRKVQKAFQKLLLWMYCMSSVAYGLDKKQPKPLLSLLKDHIQALGVASWKECRDIFKGLLWIDMIHDEVGEHVYRAALAI